MRSLQRLLGVIEIGGLGLAVLYGVLWLRDPTGPHEPKTFLAVLVSTTFVDLVRRWIGKTPAHDAPGMPTGREHSDTAFFRDMLDDAFPLLRDSGNDRDSYKQLTMGALMAPRVTIAVESGRGEAVGVIHAFVASIRYSDAPGPLNRDRLAIFEYVGGDDGRKLSISDLSAAARTLAQRHAEQELILCIPNIDLVLTGGQAERLKPLLSQCLAVVKGLRLERGAMIVGSLTYKALRSVMDDPTHLPIGVDFVAATKVLVPI